jgi:ketosteroid isomerase-like protein
MNETALLLILVGTLRVLSGETFPGFRAQDTDRGQESMPETDDVTMATLAAVQRFNEAFNRHDVDAVMAAMTADCVFENTRPTPDGTRIEGAAAVRAAWEEFFARSPQARFETEEIFAAGDRCVVRWIYRWVREGKEGHVRGVDVFRVRKGKVAEKFSYVKG